MIERIAPSVVHAYMRGQPGLYPVLRYSAFPPHKHPHESPIQRHLWCLQLTVGPTSHRWYGCNRAWIGADLRMHVEITDPRFEEMMRWEEPA